MDLLIKDVTAVTMDEPQVVEHCHIGIENGRIVWLSPEAPQQPARRVIQGRGKVAMPGLINTHTHMPMTLLRGYADDYTLQEWLTQHIFPAEDRLDARCIKAGMLLGLAEAIRFGTTSISEMYFQLPTMAEACLEAGIKANLCNAATCFDQAHYDFDKAGETREMREVLERFHGADGGRIRLDAGIHAEYTSFDQVWRSNAAFAKEHGLNMQVHVSETRKEHEECLGRWGATPVQILAENGVFDTRAIAAHCVWVTPEDMEILAEKQVTVAHNPVSNLKLASGIAPVAEMRRRGVRVALGTDGVASNNSHDLFEEIKLCALLQQGVRGDPCQMPAPDALACATVQGAFAQGREEECGRLRTGMDADLILLDFDKPWLQPVHSVISSLCYTARGQDVCLTMVKGKILYENGAFHTIDVEKARREVEGYALPRILGAHA